MRTATLDVDDETLAGLDWVIASVHHAQFDRNATERILAAMDNPHVDCDRSSHGPADRAPSRRRRRSRADRRARDRDRHGAGDQLAARPARPARQPRRASPARPAHASPSRPTRTPPRRLATRSSGSARRGGLADEGADPEHAPMGRDREAAPVSFREDGAAALEWVASLPRAVCATAGARAGRAGRVRRRCPRRRRSGPSPSPTCSATSTRCCCRASRTGRAHASSRTSRPRAPSRGSSPSCSSPGSTRSGSSGAPRRRCRSSRR